MERNKTLAKNTLFLSLGQFVPKLIAMLTLPILTTHLTKAEYGIYDLANSMVSLIVPIMTLQIQQVAFRYLVLSKNKSDQTTYLSSSLIFLFGSTIIFFPVIFLLLQFFSGYDWLSNLLICSFLISEGFYRLFGQLVRGLGYNLKYSIGVIVFSIFQLLLSGVLLIAVDGGVIGAFVAFTASYVVAIIYMFVAAKVWKYIRWSAVSTQKIKEMIGLSAPIVPSSISLWVVNLSNRFIITSLLGIEANAVYAVANKIPNLFSMAYTTFNLAWTESATLAVNDDDQAMYYSRMLNQMVRFLIGIMLLLIAFTPLLFNLFINQQYEDAYIQMPILFFAVFFSSMVAFYGAIYVAIKRTKQVGVSSAIGAVLNILINLLLLKHFGIMAASIATALSYFLICVYRAVDLNKVIAFRYDWNGIVVAMMVFLLSASLCYGREPLFVMINLVIAIVYNVRENGSMIKSLIKMVRRR